MIITRNQWVENIFASRNQQFSAPSLLEHLIYTNTWAMCFDARNIQVFRTKNWCH